MFRPAILVILLLLNLFACLALVRTIRRWVHPPQRQRFTLWVVGIVVLSMNAPLALFFLRWQDTPLLKAPLWLLHLAFYPSMAWLATILIFFLIMGPVTLVLALAGGARRLWSRYRGRRALPAAPSPPLSDPPGLSRRQFLGGSAGLLLPCLYGVTAYSVSGNFDELDISQENTLAMPHWPRSMDGLTIVQLSDLHVGPYLREKELRHVVSRVNELRPDLVVITGDILDRSLSSLPDLVRGLSGIKSSLGAFAVLGNHDISVDRYSASDRHKGGILIARGLASIGIRTLRNEVAHLGSAQERVELLGLDWLSHGPDRQGFHAYQQDLTRQQLQRMAAEAGPETPRILLAHHPDTFREALPYGIGLTLAGHTHGGGQVILGKIDGVPIGLGMFRFRYLSGLYREPAGLLYVNRGIGYLGVPIRIHCPPEISRFKLVSA